MMPTGDSGGPPYTTIDGRRTRWNAVECNANGRLVVWSSGGFFLIINKLCGTMTQLVVVGCHHQCGSAYPSLNLFILIMAKLGIVDILKNN